MSIWTSRTFSGLVFGLALTSCVAGEGDNGASGQTRSIAIAETDVVVAGPSGYCIDRRSLARNDAGSFVLLASCDALARGRRVVGQKEPMLLTVSVSGFPGVVGEPAVLKSFFGSRPGRAALSRDGRAETVEVLEMFPRGDLFLVHARDTSSGLGEGLREDYWRAFGEVNDYVVTASAIAFQDNPVSDERALNTLNRLVASIRSASNSARN